MDFLKAEIVAGNDVYQLILFFLCVFLGWLIGRIGKGILLSLSERLKKSEKPLSSIGFRALSHPALFLSIVLGVRVGFLFLVLNENVWGFASTCLQILFSIGIAWLIYALVDIPDYIFRKAAEKTESKLDDMIAPVVRKSLRLTIGVLTIVQIAQILSGKEISAIIAGLGVGGLAVALAAQDTIKNFFGSLVLLFDKPFELGERINVDGHDGTVEEVGLRSTRIRRLDGHWVTLPNGDLANKAIWNIAKRPFIRNLFKLGITYDTPVEKVKEAKAILESVFENHEGMEADFPPRVYFNEFDSHSLNFLVIVWYHPPLYWDYMAFVERTNLEILERFNAAGIDFAFPTQTLHLAGDDKRPLQVGIEQESR